MSEFSLKAAGETQFPQVRRGEYDLDRWQQKTGAVMEHNKKIIEAVELEELDPAYYYAQCCAFLADFISQRPKTAGSDVEEALTSLLKVLQSDPKSRDVTACAVVEQIVRPFLFDDRSSSEPGAVLVAALLLFAMAGKSLYFLSRQFHNSQFEREVTRLFQDVGEVRGNIWLFHLASRMAQSGFKVDFVPERKEPTPDFVAERGAVKVFVEANTRNPAARGIEAINDALWNVMHGDGSSGKQLKFKNAAFDPGLIVVDLSNCDVEANEKGLPPYLKLLSNALSVNKLGRIYDLSRDPDFFNQPENTGNLVELAVRYFHRMVGLNRYCVRALLIGTSMGVRTVEKGVLGSPKGAILVVDSRYPQLALQELATQIYLADTQSPLPEAKP
jgi:hypothetical protein